MKLLLISAVISIFAEVLVGVKKALTCSTDCWRFKMIAVGGLVYVVGCMLCGYKSILKTPVRRNRRTTR